MTYKNMAVPKIVYTVNLMQKIMWNKAQCSEMFLSFFVLSHTASRQNWKWLSTVPSHRFDVCDVTILLTPLLYVTHRHNVNLLPAAPLSRSVTSFMNDAYCVFLYIEENFVNFKTACSRTRNVQ